MRYRLLATYQGSPFEAGVGPDETGVVLFAACPPPEDLGFEPATGHWRKEVDRDAVHALYESRPVGIFRGERCVVLDELTDRLHITYLGHDALRAEQLGYWEVDRGVFELITPRQEVTEIVEQRIPVAAPVNGAGPQPPSRDVLDSPAFPPFARSSAPAYVDDPLPLEAQAMRAARNSKPSEPAAPRSESSDGRAEESARLSELSGGPPMAADRPSAVPSWSPQAITPQPAARQPAWRQASGEHNAQIADGGAPGNGLADGSVVSGGFAAGGSPPVACGPAGGRWQAAHAGAPAGPFIGSAPVPQPGPQLPGAGGQVNGTHHGGQANSQLLRPGPGMPRDQRERPASVTPDSSPSAASPPSAADAGGAAVAGGVGVAVADPVHGRPYRSAVPPEARLANAPPLASQPAEAAEAEGTSRRRRASRRRLPTQRVFSDLAAQAGIPAGAYAINEDADGAMCLVRTGEGFEVFNSLGGSRHEVRVFQDEESAYFYLFGLLAAEAVRNGALRPTP
ncbi:MAG: hypothetical protein LBV34_20690 [Nocardiopsaceae bacterium]|jgi:hypothetical protein|nr:hypothetical protein [Nocardiopsaceae bacterium]